MGWDRSSLYPAGRRPSGKGFTLLVFHHRLPVGLLGALIAMLLWFNLPSITRRFQCWASVMILLIMILWGVIPVMVSQVRLVPVLQEYSNIWDDRHQDILSESHNGGS